MAGAKDNGGYDPTVLGGDFGKKLQGYLNTPAPGMNDPTKVAISQMQNVANTSQGGFDQAFNTANDIIGKGGMASGGWENVAATEDAQNDFRSMADMFADPQQAPGYQTIRNNLSDDVRKSVYSDFGASGMFGSDSSINAAAEGLGNALGGLDYGNYQQGIQNRMGALQGQLGASQQGYGMRNAASDRALAASSMLPALQAGRLMPAQANLDAGRLLEQDANKDYNRFRELLGDFTGSASNPGMEEEAPWWQKLLGGASTAAGWFF